MFSVMANIYNKKKKGRILMELFTATGKLKKFFSTTRDVRCVHHGWHGTRRYNIQVLATHTHVNMGASIFFTAATTDLLVWYSNTQNDFFPGAAIFSLHTLALPSGRNVNYDEKQLTGKKRLSCSFYLYRFPKYVSCGFSTINFCNTGVHYEMICR